MSTSSLWIGFWATFLVVSVSAFAVMAVAITIGAWGDLKRLLRRRGSGPTG